MAVITNDQKTKIFNLVSGAMVDLAENLVREFVGPPPATDDELLDSVLRPMISGICYGLSGLCIQVGEDPPQVDQVEARLIGEIKAACRLHGRKLAHG